MSLRTAKLVEGLYSLLQVMSNHYSNWNIAAGPLRNMFVTTLKYHWCRIYETHVNEHPNQILTDYNIIKIPSFDKFSYSDLYLFFILNILKRADYTTYSDLYKPQIKLAETTIFLFRILLLSHHSFYILFVVEYLLSNILQALIIISCISITKTVPCSITYIHTDRE